MQRAGLQNAALYLIRPDGYVAFADLSANPERLPQYFSERGWQRGAKVPVRGRTTV